MQIKRNFYIIILIIFSILPLKSINSQTFFNFYVKESKDKKYVPLEKRIGAAIVGNFLIGGILNTGISKLLIEQKNYSVFEAMEKAVIIGNPLGSSIGVWLVTRKSLKSFTATFIGSSTLLLIVKITPPHFKGIAGLDFLKIAPVAIVVVPLVAVLIDSFFPYPEDSSDKQQSEIDYMNIQYKNPDFTMKFLIPDVEVLVDDSLPFKKVYLNYQVDLFQIYF